MGVPETNCLQDDTVSVQRERPGMASLRGLRKSSRMSSPATTATPQREREDSPGEAIRVKSDSRTFMDRWVEPPVREPAPSFADYKGLERHGVLEKMVPLGEKPTPKLLQRLKLLPSKQHRQSTPAQQDDDLTTPSNGLTPRAETASPADDSPRSTSYEPDEMLTRRAARQSAAALPPVTPAKSSDQESGQMQQQTEPSPKRVKVSSPVAHHIASPSVGSMASYPPTTPQRIASTPSSFQRPREDLQRILSAALAEADYRRDHISNLGLRNIWTETTTRPEILTILSNMLDGTARKHEKKVFNRYILNAKEFLRTAPAPSTFHSHPQNSSQFSPYPGTSRSGRMNGTIIEFTTPIVSQPPRQAQARRSTSSMPVPPSTGPPSHPVPTPPLPTTTTRPPTLPPVNGVKRKRESEDDKKDPKDSSRDRSLSSVSSLSDAKSLDDEIYAPKSGMGNRSEEGNLRELRVDGDAAEAPPSQSKDRAATETNEKSRQVPSRSAARTANNNLSSSLRPSTVTRSTQAKKEKVNDQTSEPFPDLPISEQKTWSDSKSLNPPNKKTTKGRAVPTVTLTEEEQQAVDEQRRMLLQDSYPIRDASFPHSSLRSPLKSKPSVRSDSSTRVTPKPDVKIHHLSKADAQLISSPVEPPPSQRELRNGSLRKRSRNEFEEEDEVGTPTSSAQADLLGPGLRSNVKDSRAGTPKVVTKPVKKLDVRKSARVIQSPQKKTGITAGMPRNVTSKQTNAGNDAESEDTDNDEECSACGGAGELICCDGCPHAFHFSCVDPPLKAVPEGQWFCSRCTAERNQGSEIDLGIFSSVIRNYDEDLPVSYTLPRQVQEYWDSVRRGSNGEYEEYAEPRTQDTFKLNRAGLVELPDPKRLRDKDNNILVCHRCKRLAASNRELVSCDYCPAKWHMDCVDHPMAIPPRRRPHDKAGSTWRCPLHVDDIMADINAGHNEPESLSLRGRLPKIRKPKRAIPYDPDQKRGYRNNGNVQVLLDEEQLSVFKTVDWMGQQVRLSEDSIKLDFIDKVRTDRLREIIMAHQLGLPPPPPKTYNEVVNGYETTTPKTQHLEYIEIALETRNPSEKDAASALIGMSRIRQEEIKPNEWQDSIMTEVANVIRNPSAEDEEASLLQLQAMINARLAKAKGQSASSNEMQDSINEQIIVDLGDHIHEETPAKSGRTTRNSKRGRVSENEGSTRPAANGVQEEEL